VIGAPVGRPVLPGADESLPADSPWPLTARAAGPAALASVGGVPLRQVAAEYGTPTYILDEQDIRQRAREHHAAAGDGEVAYAAEAFLCRFMARCAEEEGMALAVGSAGELGVAASAGFPAEQIILHGPAKAPEDVHAALDYRVGRVVIENPAEISRLAAEVPARQRVLLRVTATLDAHALPGGDAVRRILDQPGLDLVGLCGNTGCDAGAQASTVSDHVFAARRLIGLMAAIRDEHGHTLSQLNLGGAMMDDRVRAAVAGACRTLRLPVPRITTEPGRAIVGRAGVTLYRVLAVTHGTGGRALIAVDGGVSDHPHPVPDANPVRAVGQLGVARDATVLGRHGEVMARCPLPAGLRPGDLLVAGRTGAYQSAMASNYSMAGRPPVVAVRDGRARVLIRRETLADLRLRDVGL
jgi:diaminopimelate decarboxylase